MKVPEYIYSGPAAFLLLFFAWTFDKVIELLILYFIISCHELAHIAVAKIFKVKIDKIIFTPIGFMAKLNRSSMSKIYHDILISAAGPVSNLALAICGYKLNSYFGHSSEYMSFFILSNLAIFCLNILPVLPLDGGRICRTILLSTIGYRKTIFVFTILTQVISVCLVFLGIYQLFQLWYNWSLLFIGIFIYISMSGEKREIQFMMISDLINKKQINSDENMKMEYITCRFDEKIIDILQEFCKNKNYIIDIVDENNEFIGQLTEYKLLDAMVKYGYDVRAGMAIKIENNK